MKNILLLILILSAVAFAACVSAPPAAEENRTAGAGEKIRIGFSMDTLKEERWQRDKELIEKRASELGAEIFVTVADGNDERQAEQIDDLLTKGVDVLIIAPHNATVAAAMVERAKKQNVPVISYDRLINSDELDLYISYQPEKVGQMQAAFALERVPRGNYVMVYGSSTDNNAFLYKKGQLSVLQPAVERGDIKIVADQHAAEWKAEEALKIVENALTQNGDNIQAVIASNDGTAGGAISALEKRGLTGKILVTGQDAELAALQRIAAGKQSMTIYKPIQPLAFGAVDAALRLARKEPVQATGTMKAASREIPTILFEPVVVDKNNIEETIIKDGYHKRESIFTGEKQ